MHPFFARWKHQKSLRFSDVLRGLRKGALGTNGLNMRNDKSKGLENLILIELGKTKIVFEANSKDTKAMSMEIILAKMMSNLVRYFPRGLKQYPVKCQCWSFFAKVGNDWNIW